MRPVPVTSGAADLLLWDVLEEHLEEAAYLLEQWEAALDSAATSRRELRESVEARLLAHLDGLVLAGAAGEQLLWSVVTPPRSAEDDDEGDEDRDEDARTRTAAAVLALLFGTRDLAAKGAGGPEAVAQKVLSSAVKLGEEGQRGVLLALQFWPHDDVHSSLLSALESSTDEDWVAGLRAVLISRGIATERHAGSWLASGEPEVIAQAFDALARTSQRGPFFLAVDAGLRSADEAVREAALRTSLVWGLASGWKLCQELARSGDPKALLHVALAGGPSETTLLVEALRKPELADDALFALGFTGTVPAADACLAAMKTAEATTAKLALEAFAAITGLPTDDPALTQSPPVEPEDEEDLPELEEDLPELEEDLETDLSLDAIDELPLPNVEGVERWWAENREHLVARSSRLLRGKPRTADTVAVALEEEPLRRRGALAVEIAIRTGGTVWPPMPRVGDRQAVVVPATIERGIAWR